MRCRIASGKFSVEDGIAGVTAGSLLEENIILKVDDTSIRLDDDIFRRHCRVGASWDGGRN